MNEPHTPGRNAQRTSGAHGAFKHKAKPASLNQVLTAFGIDRATFESSKADVLHRTRREPVHAR